MTNDLIERYIYAATKRLPEKIKNDVSEELRTLIDDMLAERCGEVVPEEKDIKVVLTELGTPNELYEKYNPDAKKCLIGSPYYSTYKYVLKIVLICVIFGMILSTVISGIIDMSETEHNYVEPWIDMITNLIINVSSGVIGAFSFVTLLFAFFYHKNVKIDTTDNLDDLPPIPKKRQTISKWEPIIGIGISVVFLVVFLAAPQIFCTIHFGETTEVTPIFNIDTIRETWYIIVMFSIVGIVREIVKLIEGRYNKKVMISTITANIVSALLSVWWLTNDKIMNPNFSENISHFFKEDSQFISNIFSNFQYFFLAVIIFALLLDTFEAVFKTLKSK